MPEYFDMIVMIWIDDSLEIVGSDTIWENELIGVYNE